MLDSNELYKLWYETYMQQGQAWLIVRSGSMSPMIQVGDRILVRYAAPQQIKFGEIIVFRESNRLIIHRVIGRSVHDRYIIFLQKGDNCDLATPIQSRSVLGRVVCIKKGDRFIRLSGYTGKRINSLLGLAFYAGYKLRRNRIGATLVRLLRRCLMVLFSY